MREKAKRGREEREGGRKQRGKRYVVFCILLCLRGQVEEIKGQRKERESGRGAGKGEREGSRKGKEITKR